MPVPRRSAQPRLQVTTFASRFRIGIARGWQVGQKDTAIALIAPRSKAEVDVYYASEERSLNDLASDATRFLKTRHPDGRVTAPHPVRVGLLQGLRIKAVYRGGSESALVLVDSGFTYVLLQRVDRGASAAAGETGQGPGGELQPGLVTAGREPAGARAGQLQTLQAE